MWHVLAVGLVFSLHCFAVESLFYKDYFVLPFICVSPVYLHAVIASCPIFDKNYSPIQVYILTCKTAFYSTIFLLSAILIIMRLPYIMYILFYMFDICYRIECFFTECIHVCISSKREPSQLTMAIRLCCNKIQTFKSPQNL